MSAEWLTSPGLDASFCEPTFHASHTGGSCLVEPIRYRAWPVSWCWRTKEATAPALSPCGSTDTATIATRRCIDCGMLAYALCRLEAISGHTSGQWAYRKVTNTALPRCAARLKELPS